jgi:hypothetical protein
VAADSLRITRKISQGASTCTTQPEGNRRAQFQTDEDLRLPATLPQTTFSPGRDKKWAAPTT